MFFAAFVLVPVDGKHDGLQQCIDLGHGNKTTQMRNVSRLRLEEEKQVAVLLRLVVVGEEALLQFGGLFEVACDFVLLCIVSTGAFQMPVCTPTSSKAMRFWMSSAIRESR